MFIKEVIDRADEIAPNGFSKEQKYKWLSTLDHLIYRTIIATHHYNLQEVDAVSDLPLESRGGEYGIAYRVRENGKTYYWTGYSYTEEPYFNGYNEATDAERHLIAPEPFAEMYKYWLLAQMDLANREINGYNTNAMLYTEWKDKYAAWYNREHMPIQRAREVYF